MNARKRTLAWLSGGVALMVVGTVVAFLLARGCTPDPPPPLVLSKETTWLTGPPHADGGIDWVAAIEAEARAAGLKDEENGAPLMKEALEGLLTLEAYVEAHEPSLHYQPGVVDDYGVHDAVDAVGRGDLAGEQAAAVLRWLEAIAPALEQARRAADRPSWFVTVTKRPLDQMPTRAQLRNLYYVRTALRLRLMVRATRGDVDGSLVDAATASTLDRRVGSPATLFEQQEALDRETELLGTVLCCVRGAAMLPADRALAAVDAVPVRWSGEAALREAMRAERLYATSTLDTVRFIAVPAATRKEPAYMAMLRAFQRIDPNPGFRRLQHHFDELDRELLGSDRPAHERFDGACALMERKYEEIGASLPTKTGPLGFLLYPDDRLAELFPDEVAHYPMRFMHRFLASWLTFTARRDALLAELAFLAGASERRDSWLGEPLVVTRKEDGSIEVGGALLEFARARDPEFDEEE